MSRFWFCAPANGIKSLPRGIMEALAVSHRFLLRRKWPTLCNNWAVPQRWLKSVSVAGRRAYWPPQHISTLEDSWRKVQSLYCLNGAVA
jgi:hypothetical protein